MKVILFDDFHRTIYDTLKKWNFEVIDGRGFTTEDIKNHLDINGIFIRSSIPLNATLLSQFKYLKFIARPGAGLENIDLNYCQQADIRVFRSPEGNRDALAEHTMGMILSLLNNINSANTEVKNGVWLREENRGIELNGKVFALIGYGFMGEALARRLSGFDVQVIAFDKYKSNFSDPYVKEVDMNYIFNNADFVSLHTPQSSETKKLVNSTFINSFKKPFFLINTARGQSVVLEDLLKGIENKKIKGACLDVMELESPSFERFSYTDDPTFKSLAQYKNVIFTPHIAGWTQESKEKMALVILDKIKKMNK
jgi:D-3-phosphoglycerate dehydrogenase